MLYEMLILSFKEGDWLIGIICWVLFLFILMGVWLGADYLWQERKWSQVREFKWEATLISNKYKSSTREIHAVPVVTGKGVGVGMVSTGEDEKYITVWDCGKYGRLVSDNETVFRWAKEKSFLWLKELDGEVRIVGIEN